MTVCAAEKALENQTAGPRQEIVPSFADLNGTMYYTLCCVAERAGLVHKELTRLTNSVDSGRFASPASGSADWKCPGSDQPREVSGDFTPDQPVSSSNTLVMTGLLLGGALELPAFA